MTPVDPVFLLIPILRAALPVRVSPINYIEIHALTFAIQTDGTLGSFRPADDIFEEAAVQLTKAALKDKDPSTMISEKDVLFLLSLECIRNALKRMCDVKGSGLLDYPVLKF